eukprot:2560884-Alexandrium_andersonii.AAC.1
MTARHAGKWVSGNETYLHLHMTGDTERGVATAPRRCKKAGTRSQPHPNSPEPAGRDDPTFP